uniref:Ribosomal protein S4 n=1 Tax=Ulva rigida TaxID=75689 RepID=A0A7L9R4U0_9CHLO|nr:ribosomal protein S4 [Ulva rigida]QOL10405.1 ribosomal protein S4 [Ulva rigida]
MTSNSKKLDNTKIINHLNNLNKVNKVQVDNSKQLTLLSNTTESLLNKTKPIKFNGFLNKLLTANNALVKLILFSFLKGSTSTTGFKQVLYNRIRIENNRLYPLYNRRKHSHSHHILITNQLGKLSKTFHYLSRNKLKNFITLALTKALGYKGKSTNTIPYCFISRHISARSTPDLIAILETQICTLIWRNQFKHCLGNSRQAVLHANFQMLLKNNTALIIKK